METVVNETFTNPKIRFTLLTTCYYYVFDKNNRIRWYQNNLLSFIIIIGRRVFQVQPLNYFEPVGIEIVHSNYSQKQDKNNILDLIRLLWRQGPSSTIAYLWYCKLQSVTGSDFYSYCQKGVVVKILFFIFVLSFSLYACNHLGRCCSRYTQ